MSASSEHVQYNRKGYLEWTAQHEATLGKFFGNLDDVELVTVGDLTEPMELGGNFRAYAHGVTAVRDALKVEIESGKWPVIEEELLKQQLAKIEQQLLSVFHPEFKRPIYNLSGFLGFHLNQFSIVLEMLDFSSQNGNFAESDEISDEKKAMRQRLDIADGKGAKLLATKYLQNLLEKYPSILSKQLAFWAEGSSAGLTQEERSAFIDAFRDNWSPDALNINDSAISQLKSYYLKLGIGNEEQFNTEFKKLVTNFKTENIVQRAEKAPIFINRLKRYGLERFFNSVLFDQSDTQKLFPENQSLETILNWLQRQVEALSAEITRFKIDENHFPIPDISEFDKEAYLKSFTTYANTVLENMIKLGYIAAGNRREFTVNWGNERFSQRNVRGFATFPSKTDRNEAVKIFLPDPQFFSGEQQKEVLKVLTYYAPLLAVHEVGTHVVQLGNYLPIKSPAFGEGVRIYMGLDSLGIYNEGLVTDKQLFGENCDFFTIAKEFAQLEGANLLNENFITNIPRYLFLKNRLLRAVNGIAEIKYQSTDWSVEHLIDELQKMNLPFERAELELALTHRLTNAGELLPYYISSSMLETLFQEAGKKGIDKRSVIAKYIEFGCLISPNSLARILGIIGRGETLNFLESNATLGY